MNFEVTKKHIEKFITNYNIGKFSSYKKIKKGFGNLLYIITTSRGKYILKIAVRNNPIRVNYEIDLLNYIENLPVPRIIRAKNEEYLLNFNAINKAFIYKYIDGKIPETINGGVLKSVGRFLGNYHNLVVSYKSNIKRLEFYNISQKSFVKMINISRKTNNIKIKKAVRSIEENFLKFPISQKLPRGAMHIDLKPENILVKNNKLSGVVDFDNSYIGPLLLDLVNTLMWFSSENGKFNFKKAKIIFKNYLQKRKLSALEQKYFFNALHYVFLSHMLIDIYLLVSKTDQLRQKYIYWGIDNLLATEKNLNLTPAELNKKFGIK